jgi:hypothetical protein
MLRPALLALALLAAPLARADQNADIYNGILAEAQLRDGGLLHLGRQGRAALFAASVKMISDLAKSGPAGRVTTMEFTLAPDPATGLTHFTGRAEVNYMRMPVCTRAVLTVIGTFPTGDASNQNYTVESVNVEVADSSMCM